MIHNLVFTVTPHFTVRSYAVTWNVNISILPTAGFLAVVFAVTQPMWTISGFFKWSGLEWF